MVKGGVPLADEKKPEEAKEEKVHGPRGPKPEGYGHGPQGGGYGGGPKGGGYGPGPKGEDGEERKPLPLVVKELSEQVEALSKKVDELSK